MVFTTHNTKVTANSSKITTKPQFLKFQKVMKRTKHRIVLILSPQLRLEKVLLKQGQYTADLGQFRIQEVIIIQIKLT